MVEALALGEIDEVSVTERPEISAPVFVGDTIRARTTVAEARPSKSRADAGIVTFEHQAFNQKDELVARCLRAALMLRAPA